MYEGYGGYQREITTSSREAQRWFDQGLQLVYGFNHDEAIRSFREAARLDPDCAMAWWGVAHANGIHVNKGIGCASCHGRVDRMNLMYQASPLTMEWCLACHRNPEKYVRPREEVFNMEYVPVNQEVLGPRLVKEYQIAKLTSCSTCHY